MFFWLLDSGGKGKTWKSLKKILDRLGNRRYTIDIEIQLQ